MIEELDDNVEFDTLLEDKRHKEVVSSLKAVLFELQKDKSNDNIEKEILKQTGIISEFVEAVKSINTNVNVETNQDKVTTCLEIMCDNILKGIKDLKESIDNRPKEWEFKLNRNLGVVQGGTFIAK